MQAAPSRPSKVAGTTAAEVGPHDGGDDAWHAASKWLSCWHGFRNTGRGRQDGAKVLSLSTDREERGGPDGRERGQSSSPTQGPACGARRTFSLEDFAAGPAGDGKKKIKEEIQEKGLDIEKTSGRKEWNSGSGGSGQEDRPRREAAQKATDALKKGADATRGRGKGRMYQRAGIRN